ncbi:phenylalanine--tRNA ligase subunit beta [Paenibacillus protaetiae]|uniref:Phenylalanine--tRNA ligase beta subunit n=1 Tax=Paenibacillus protaetiae TaxID=2509456 RepID=A0A4V0YF66_9BACL|nr:phenylalanine--tRNA ligase subunit beta [Paenibacillus protaetiae]QAY66641.1 phenylalanine--tRNA ligase subunit beta [Paenibacillus protaetiae]
MKVSYQWLNEYIDLSGFAAEELAEKITRGGIEVDGVEPRDKGVTGVVVGYVKSREKHPDADKLNVCKVDVGTGEELQIVCGAKNVDAGQKVPVATVGAKLPGGLHIKRAKLRGVESQGMICSAKELGINDKLLPKEQQEGILVLPETLPLGTPIVEVLGLNDEVLELDLTPNRSDALSMLGVAYEVGALIGRQVRLPEAGVNHASDRADSHVTVKVRVPELAPQYHARYIKDVTIGRSPLWLQNRLIAAGIRPINNVVDVTNFVLHEYGQPLHAFDADLIKDGRIEVRLAEAGEILETLDGQERKLEPHMLVITDGSKPIALAGVMGGANSEVTDGTVNIILESAKFDGGTVRKTSRQLGLRSEASIRFEKEVDPGRVIPALDRAAALIAELAGGLVTEGIVSAVYEEGKAKQVRVTLDKINRYLGTELSALEVRTIFERLSFDCAANAEGEFTVEVPTRRGDITLDVDLIEEVARLYGYDNIKATAIHGDIVPGALTKPQAIRRELRKRLTDAGLHEIVGYSFTSPDKAALFPVLAGEGSKPVKLAMPMSEDRSVLRTSLAAQMLETAAYNRNRKIESVSIFEIGSVFHSDEEQLTRQPKELHRLAGLLAGNRVEAQWNRKAAPVNFYDAKGVLETVFEALGLSGKISYEAAQPEGFHPGRTAAVILADGESPRTIGYIGQLHPELQRSADLADTYVFEITLDAVYEAAESTIVYKELPRFPASQRDIAVVLDNGVPAASLTETAWNVAGELLEQAQVFDVYTGEKLGAGKKSVAISLVYRHAERTLTDEEVTELHGKVVAALEQSFAAELRK